METLHQLRSPPPRSPRSRVITLWLTMCRDRGLFRFQKSDIGKLQDCTFSMAPDHKREPLSVWRKCEILRTIYRVASLVFRHDPERNERRIVFKLMKDIDSAAATGEWRRSTDTHMMDLNCNPAGTILFSRTFSRPHYKSDKGNRKQRPQ
jgi:hypothetical protein